MNGRIIYVIAAVFVETTAGAVHADSGSVGFVSDERGYYCSVPTGECIWEEPELRWALHGFPESTNRAVIESALMASAAKWAAVLPIHFVKVDKKDQADVLITWALGGKQDPLWMDVFARSTPPGKCAGITPTPCSPRLMVFMTEKENEAIKWSFDGATVPVDAVDFESAALHEWGHMLGIGGHCGMTGNPPCQNGGQVMENGVRGAMEQKTGLRICALTQ